MITESILEVLEPIQVGKYLTISLKLQIQVHLAPQHTRKKLLWIVCKCLDAQGRSDFFLNLYSG